MKSIPFAFLIVFCVAIWEFGSTNPVALSCDSCGSECARACGTRHFRSCCFNYVRKRSQIFHPYSLNQHRYETLYRQFPYENNHEISPNQIEKEQQPRKGDSSTQNVGAPRSEITDSLGNLKNFYKPWKDAGSSEDIPVVVEDYASEPKQTVYDA